MRIRFLLAAVLLAGALPARADGAAYQIDLVPSGRLLAFDAPLLKGGVYTFHRIPDGIVMSVRKSDVKDIFLRPLGPEWNHGLTEIGALARDGAIGSSQAGPQHLNTVITAKTNSGLGHVSYGNVAPGATQGANSVNDDPVGLTIAAPPAGATQSSPGALPR